MSEGRIRVARENHQFSAHRSLELYLCLIVNGAGPAIVRGPSRRRASVGLFKPAYLVRYALLRKPTKGANCNGLPGRLSTKQGLDHPCLSNSQRLRTGWNDEDFQLFVLGNLGLRFPGCGFILEEPKQGGPASGQQCHLSPLGKQGLLDLAE